MKQTEVLTHGTHVNGWKLAVYIRYMNQNFRLFHVSNVSVRIFQIFLVMYPGSEFVSGGAAIRSRQSVVSGHCRWHASAPGRSAKPAGGLRRSAVCSRQTAGDAVSPSWAQMPYSSGAPLYWEDRRETMDNRSPLGARCSLLCSAGYCPLYVGTLVCSLVWWQGLTMSP